MGGPLPGNDRNKIPGLWLPWQLSKGARWQFLSQSLLFSAGSSQVAVEAPGGWSSWDRLRQQCVRHRVTIIEPVSVQPTLFNTFTLESTVGSRLALLLVHFGLKRSNFTLMEPPPLLTEFKSCFGVFRGTKSGFNKTDLGP